MAAYAIGPDFTRNTARQIEVHLRAIQRATRWSDMSIRAQARLDRLELESEGAQNEYVAFADGAPMYRAVGSLPAHLLDIVLRDELDAETKILTLRALTKTYPNCRDTWRILAEALLQTRANDDEAIEAYGMAARLDPARLSIFSNIARLHIDQGRLGDAALACAAGVNSFEMERARNPDQYREHETWDLRISHARMLKDLGRFDEALYFAEDCVLLVPLESSCLSTLAKYYNEAAIRLLERGGERDRTRVQAAVRYAEAANDFIHGDPELAVVLEANLTAMKSVLARLA